MKQYILVFLQLIAIKSVFLNAFQFTDITELGYEQYQDIIINNVVVKPASGNRRDCVSRYEIIKKVHNQYNRPFTMLDLGASQGYYSFRTAHDYDCVCVMIEGNNPAYPMVGSQLLELCSLNTDLHNIILLNKLIKLEDLQKLGNCEHFDVVLCLNIIHWFPECWQEMTDAILFLGESVIIETPPQEILLDTYNASIRKNIENYLLSKNATIIGQVKRHTSETFSNIYLVQNTKTALARKDWNAEKSHELVYKIVSNYNEKRLFKVYQKGQITTGSTQWEPGINYVTFKNYGGAFPESNFLEKTINNLINNHKVSENNIIIQGINTKLTSEEARENKR